MKKAPQATGPERNGQRTVRINPRFPEATAARLKEASAIRGQSVAAFVLEAVAREAERVLEEETRWKLSLAESAKIQRLLAKPPAPNAAAKKAAKDLATHVRIRS
ncbi:MAG: DUF1778 domain-containing protein [Akkermansiaceae bacterium]|nr:DUF1778 domain-containing protein [Akkermansiaceae bacterium]